MSENRNGKRVMSQEQRERWNKYMREYRKNHPEAVKRWNDAYTLRRAAKLQAQAGGSTNGGN